MAAVVAVVFVLLVLVVVEQVELLVTAEFRVVVLLARQLDLHVESLHLAPLARLGHGVRSRVD